MAVATEPSASAQEGQAELMGARAHVSVQAQKKGGASLPGDKGACDSSPCPVLSFPLPFRSLQHLCKAVTSSSANTRHA